MVLCELVFVIMVLTIWGTILFCCRHEHPPQTRDAYERSEDDAKAEAAAGDAGELWPDPDR